MALACLLASAFPGITAGPFCPPLRTVSSCLKSSPEILASPWQLTHARFRIARAERSRSEAGGDCEPGGKKSANDRVGVASPVIASSRRAIGIWSISEI